MARRLRPHPLDAGLLWLFGRWMRLSRRTHRIVLLTILVPTVMIGGADAALASSGSAAPAVFSWVNIKDTHGVPAWNYQLSIGGDSVWHPVETIFGIITSLCWGIYQLWIILLAWMVNWVLSFGWLNMVSKPLIGFGQDLHVILFSHFGVVNTLLTLAALVSVMYMMRGKWLLGIFELGLSCVIAILAVGVLANPMKMVAGDHGALAMARDSGLQIAVGLNNHGNLAGESTDTLRKQEVGMLLDTFLRKPQQLVNFGKVEDGTKCAGAYQKAVKTDPTNLKDDVGNCDGNASDYASSPGLGMVMSALALDPVGWGAGLFCVVLMLGVLVSGLYALWQSLKGIWSLFVAIAPGGSKGSLWMTLAELIISLVTLAVTVVFLAGYLLLLQDVMSAGGNSLKSFFIADILMLVGLIVYWRARHRLKKSTDRLAAALSKRPGGGKPTSLPARNGLSGADMYYRAKMARNGAMIAAKGAAGIATGGVGLAAAAGTLSKAAARPVANAWDKVMYYGGPDSPLGGTGEGPNGTGPSTGPGSPPPGGRPGGGAAERLNKQIASRRSASRGGQLVRMTTHLGVAAMTGGTSAVAHTAGRQALVSGARRVALQSKLHPDPHTSSHGERVAGPTITRRPGRAPSQDPHAPRPAPSNAPQPSPAAGTVVTGEVVKGEVVKSAPQKPSPGREAAARLQQRMKAARRTGSPLSQARRKP